MSTMHQLRHMLHDNPLARREVITRQRSGGKWFWRITWGGTIFLFVVVPLILGFLSDYAANSIDSTVSFQILVNFIALPLVVIQTIMHAHGSMKDEHDAKTWELLSLTGIGAGRMVLGKWLGVMRSLLPNYVWLLTVRLGVFFWVAISVILYDIGRYSTLTDMPYLPFSLGYIFGIIIVYSVLELMLSAALGIAVGMIGWKRRTGAFVGIVTRVAIGLIAFFGTMAAYGYFDLFDNRPYVDYPTDQESYIFTVAAALGTNGSFSSFVLLATIPSYKEDIVTADDVHRSIRTAQSHMILVYLLLTGITLGVAFKVAKRQGIAADGGYLPTPKRKRKTAPQPTHLPQHAKERISATPGTANALTLAAPQVTTVELFHYQRRSGRLYLRLNAPDEAPRYVQLSSVLYMDAPTRWQGADIRVAETAAYDAFIAEHNLAANSFRADAMRLYIIETADDAPTVHIVAGAMTLLDKLPDHI